MLSNANPYHTFLELMPSHPFPAAAAAASASAPESDSAPLPTEFVDHVRHTDYACGAFKINCAVDKVRLTQSHQAPFP